MSSQWKALWLSYWKHVFWLLLLGIKLLKLLLGIELFPGWIFRCMPCCTYPEMVPTGSSPLRSCPIFLELPPGLQLDNLPIQFVPTLGKMGHWKLPSWGQIFEWHLGQWSLGKSNGRNFQLRSKKSKKKPHSKFAPENGGLFTTTVLVSFWEPAYFQVRKTSCQFQVSGSHDGFIKPRNKASSWSASQDMWPNLLCASWKWDRTIGLRGVERATFSMMIF